MVAIISLSSLLHRTKIQEKGKKCLPCDENSQDRLLNFPMYHPAALAISTMFYITSLILIYLITRNLYLLPPCFSSHSPNYQPLLTTNLTSFSECGF